jgi:hypothetical protein
MEKERQDMGRRDEILNCGGMDKNGNLSHKDMTYSTWW